MSQAHVAHGAHDEHVQSDTIIERDRLSRAIVACASPLAAVWLGNILGTEVALWGEISTFIGEVAGTIIGGVAGAWTWRRSFIENDEFIGFLTKNDILSLFKLGSPYIWYGPGRHFCYWWESRSEESGVSLAEESEPIDFVVQGKGGDFTVKGSVRMRADVQHLPRYLSGPAAVVDDIIDLITKEIVRILSGKSVEDAIQAVPEINEALEKIFVHGNKKRNPKVSAIEERFSVMIGDVTVATITPSDEVKKALNGVAENKALGQMVAQRLGREDYAAVIQAVALNEISKPELENAWKWANITTDNVHGMDLKEHRLDINLNGLTGIDPEVAKGIGTGIATAAALVVNKGAQTDTNTPKSKKPRGPKK